MSSFFLPDKISDRKIGHLHALWLYGKAKLTYIMFSSSV